MALAPAVTINVQGDPVPSPIEDPNEESSEDEAIDAAPGAQTKKKKKKKKKPKSKGAKTAAVVFSVDPTPPPETPEEQAKWEKELVPRLTVSLPSWGLLNISYRSTLALFRTEGCRSLHLTTPRLKLRQVESGDLTGIVKIKTEPIVQKTQLYGSPTATDCRDSFLNRYLRSSIPRASGDNHGVCREEYIFAITLNDPSSITLPRAQGIRISSRLSSADGYLGNIALSLEPTRTSHASPSDLWPQPGRVFSYPPYSQTDQGKVNGSLFYELHPQLWGQGIMSEAFEEVLRFAMEEVGCQVVISNPTTVNPASIKLCVKNGMIYSHTNSDNPYNKPQAFYQITREEWWKRNRVGKPIKGVWEGKEVCRWCLNFRRSSPAIRCKCNWARYCSRECQRADWIHPGGHQDECDAK